MQESGTRRVFSPLLYDPVELVTFPMITGIIIVAAVHTPMHRPEQNEDFMYFSSWVDIVVG